LTHIPLVQHTFSLLFQCRAAPRHLAPSPYTPLFRSLLWILGLLGAMGLVGFVAGIFAFIVAFLRVKAGVAWHKAGIAASIAVIRSEEHTSELQSREISYAVFCLKKKRNNMRTRHEGA